MQKVRTAVGGCGEIGDLHAAALRGLSESEVVAACSRLAEKASAFAQQYRIAPFTDVKEMIAKARVEAVCICTPHPQHAAPTITAAQLGVHALVEKPLASSLADCDAMLAAARAGGATLGTI